MIDPSQTAPGNGLQTKQGSVGEREETRVEEGERKTAAAGALNQFSSAGSSTYAGTDAERQQPLIIASLARILAYMRVRNFRRTRRLWRRCGTIYGFSPTRCGGSLSDRTQCPDWHALPHALAR